MPGGMFKTGGDFGFTPNNNQTPQAARAWPHKPARMFKTKHELQPEQ
jgi:hypothetical protein